MDLLVSIPVVLFILMSFEVNSRGLEIFSKSWLPESGLPKAVVCFCHGYGDTCTFFFEGIARKLASSGFGDFALDYPGFGLSEGLHGYIPSFDRLVDEVIEHFSKVRVTSYTSDYGDVTSSSGSKLNGIKQMSLHVGML